ncbi:MAG: SprT-like domain-containing protein [Bacteroidales bacterium]|nr:SprT-like domain-containing protein [Bacteroidales bacterium]
MIQQQYMARLDKDSLKKYIPEKAVDDMYDLLIAFPVHLKIVKSRKQIRGSYRRPLQNTIFHQITINNDLNPYVFLITLLHEMAHLHAWAYHRHARHGKTWKNCFRLLIMQFLMGDVFPDDIRIALLDHLQNVLSSDAKDIHLTKILQKYDVPSAQSDNLTLLEDLPQGSVFSYGTKIMEKKQLRRKYYLCRDVNTNRLYTFHPLVKVDLITEKPNIQNIKQ